MSQNSLLNFIPGSLGHRPHDCETWFKELHQLADPDQFYLQDLQEQEQVLHYEAAYPPLALVLVAAAYPEVAHVPRAALALLAKRGLWSPAQTQVIQHEAFQICGSTDPGLAFNSIADRSRLLEANVQTSKICLLSLLDLLQICDRSASATICDGAEC